VNEVWWGWRRGVVSEVSNAEELGCDEDVLGKARRCSGKARRYSGKARQYSLRLNNLGRLNNSARLGVLGKAQQWGGEKVPWLGNFPWLWYEWQCTRLNVGVFKEYHCWFSPFFSVILVASFSSSWFQIDCFFQIGRVSDFVSYSLLLPCLVLASLSFSFLFCFLFFLFVIFLIQGWWCCQRNCSKVHDIEILELCLEQRYLKLISCKLYLYN